MMRQRWVRRCVSIGTTVAAVGATWSIAVWAATPVEVLTATAEAARTQNFQGVAIYSDGYGSDDYLKAVRIIHRYKNNVESERVTALNGAPCEIFRVDGRVFCVLPKDQTLQLSGAPLKGFLRQLTPERLHQVAAWYDFKNLGEQRIAARSCVGAAVMPRDAFRYGYEVWADEQTHIPLKFSLVNQAGKVLEQVMFTEIDYPADIPDDVFTTQVNTAKFRVVSQPEPPPLPFQPLASGDPAR
jgi:sigma-E factor negative regulatory protein RseB